MIKDDIITTLIPDVVSECALYLSSIDNSRSTCMSDKTATDIGAALNISPADDIIETAKTKLNCTTEKCVLTKMTPHLGKDRVRKELMNLKIPGPTDDKLLSNINIDAILQQYYHFIPEFYPYNFNMLNYASYSYRDGYVLEQPDTLATVNFAELYANDYRCAGCIINSDVYQGGGKHWMALFADARGDINSPWSVEFFNSSGNAPAPEWVSWLIKTRAAMEQINKNVKVVKVSDIRHQRSKTECGVYSLFYIWARLHNVPHEYFAKYAIPDQLMFEFRHHLFDDPRRKSLAKFDWDEYQSEIKIKWE